MIEEIFEIVNQHHVLVLACLIIPMGANFRFILKHIDSDRWFVSTLVNTVIGLVICFCLKDIIMKIPKEFTDIVFFAVSLNSVKIIELIKDRFYKYTKNQIKKKLDNETNT